MRSQTHVNTRNAWIFFGITIGEALVICALEAILLFFVASSINLRDNIHARTVPTYLAIYILAAYRSPFVRPFLGANAWQSVSGRSDVYGYRTAEYHSNYWTRLL